MPATIPAKEVQSGVCPLCSPLDKAINLEQATFSNDGPVLRCTQCHCRFFPKKAWGFKNVYELHIHRSDLDQSEPELTAN